MANLMINDLVESKELDSKAMADVYGGNELGAFPVGNILDVDSNVYKDLFQAQTGTQTDVTTIVATSNGDGAQLITADNDKTLYQTAFGLLS